MRPLLASLLAVAALAACDESPQELALQTVTSGTLGGIPFTVLGGAVYQAGPDGPLFADETGGRIVLDDDPAGLGMSDPNHLHLRTRFALSDAGTLQIAAFGTSGSELTSGHWVLLARDGAAIEYQFRLRGALFADSAFTPAPAIPSAEHWIVTEFYAADVPGYAAGSSGVTMWELNDLTPGFDEDVLSCNPGPAIESVALTGDAVAYALESGWLLAVQPVDQIVGPCQ